MKQFAAAVFLFLLALFITFNSRCQTPGVTFCSTDINTPTNQQQP